MSILTDDRRVLPDFHGSGSEEPFCGSTSREQGQIVREATVMNMFMFNLCINGGIRDINRASLF
jgi:hypothetical protein